MRSGLYVGRVRHRRLSPVPHAFDYRLFMTYLDLGELDEVFAGRWLWSTRRAALVRYCREDFLGDPEIPLDEAVRARVAEELGRRPSGPIGLLTHLRTFGHSFNPVSFYYCFEEDGETLDAIVAEITNTPWNERHAYVLDVRRARTRGRTTTRFDFQKDFHVSPFMPMEQEYRWRLSQPGERLVVHMENRESGARCFDALLALERREIGARSLASALLNFPLMTLKVVAAIYFQAARLWLKRVPFHSHPRTRTRTSPQTERA